VKANAREAHAKQRREFASQTLTRRRLASVGAPFSATSLTSTARTVPHLVSISAKTLSCQSGSSDNQQRFSISSESPFQPLSSILNIHRVCRPLTLPPKYQHLTAYHASRSGGTGKGYICASVPLELYKKMTNVSSKYPVFVVPISR